MAPVAGRGRCSLHRPAARGSLRCPAGTGKADRAPRTLSAAAALKRGSPGSRRARNASIFSCGAISTPTRPASSGSSSDQIKAANLAERARVERTDQPGAAAAEDDVLTPRRAAREQLATEDRHAAVKALFDNGWMHLFATREGRLHARYRPGGTWSSDGAATLAA